MAKKQEDKTTQAGRTIVRANVNRSVIESPTFVSLYANDTQVQVSPWDVRLIFGVISEPASPERQSVLVKSVGEVRVSPQHAKAITMILLQQLKVYEEAIGPIAMPQD